MKKIVRKVSGWFADKGDDAKVISARVTRDAISGAYKTRKDDIDSLRRYDRGEKTIDAPDLGNLVQRL
jgi:hypothetical protein